MIRHVLLIIRNQTIYYCIRGQVLSEITGRWRAMAIQLCQLDNFYLKLKFRHKKLI